MIRFQPLDFGQFDIYINRKFYHSINQSRNKRPMGHIAHLINKFKSIKMNTFERSYEDIYHKIGTIVQEEKIFKFRESPLLRGLTFPFKQT